MSIKDNWDAIPCLHVKKDNAVKNYLTFRSHQGKEADSAAVMGKLLALVSRKSLLSGMSTDKALKRFLEACTQRLHEKLADPEFEELVHKMYFDDGARGLYKVSPEFLLLKDKESSANNTRHVLAVFGNMFIESGLYGNIHLKNINFLEAELQQEFQALIEDCQPSSDVRSYLPYIARVFSEDLLFLCQHPVYLMQNIKAFIGLYNFLYSAQLALNIRSWRSEPVSKPLYFILDTEKASAERKRVKNSVSELRSQFERLYPSLSALEYLNQTDSKTASRYPLWMHYQYLDGLPESEKSEKIKQLETLINLYLENRGLPKRIESIDSAESAITAITNAIQDVFTKKSGPREVNSKIRGVFENEVARHFIQDRKRGGLVLIINQDYLLLLTNLAIGSEPKIQFQKLLECFRSRGVWFDQQSEQALIQFYERVGNLERMSDSGDAVYVKKTV